jgi:HD-GYP domain-containing protein (c-di-GMP phosphodiesterase class II)
MTSDRLMTIPGRFEAGAAVDEAIDQVTAGVNALEVEQRRLTEENEGLAQEVLRSYEQLNMIFDITSHLAEMTDPREVKRLMFDRLRWILHADGVRCLGRRPGMDDDEIGPAAVACGDYPLPMETEAALSAAIDKVRSTEAGRHVAVKSLSVEGAMASAAGLHVMLGPLAEWADAGPSVVCIFRCGGGFDSGDMLLFDSVLMYGGHVLRNLHLVERLKRTAFESVRALVNAIDKKDQYTSGHSERVGTLARLTGREMGLPPEQLQELEWAGLLHDIGKIGIPEQILNKPGRLTDDEFAVIKSHPQMSYDVLSPVASLGPVLQAVMEHHENFDGSGYPRGLRGEAISLAGRILHVVDVFDALTSSRSYRGAYDPKRALTMIQREAGTKLDPGVVDKFMVVLGRIEPALEREMADCRTELLQESA